jgi:hypothetical protein
MWKEQQLRSLKPDILERQNFPGCIIFYYYRKGCLFAMKKEMDPYEVETYLLT